MPLNKLKRAYEERRLNLVETLQRNKESFELSKQHQLYGAIKEIEHFLKTIDSVREEQLRGEDFELRREGPEPIKSRAILAVREAGGKTKRFFVAVFIGVPAGIIRGTGRALHRTRRKFRMYKEALHEVKRRDEHDRQ